jgi:pimeloyl-ACP methyl ester carboxylesterase
LTLRHADRVRSLILSGTMAGGPGATPPSPVTIQQFVSLASVPMKDAVEAGLRFFYSADYIAKNKVRLVARALKNAALMPPPHALQKQVMAVIGFSAHGRLGDIRCPTLILHGTEDVIVPFPNAAVLAQGIAGSRKIDYAGVGHGFLAEVADEVNAAALEFLVGHRTHFVPA